MSFAAGHLTCLPRRCGFVTDGHSSRVAWHAISAQFVRYDSSTLGHPRPRRAERDARRAVRDIPGQGRRELAWLILGGSPAWGGLYRSRLCASEPATLVVPGSGELYLGTNDDSVASSGGWTVNTKIGAPTAAVTVTILLAWTRA